MYLEEHSKARDGAVVGVVCRERRERMSRGGPFEIMV